MKEYKGFRYQESKTSEGCWEIIMPSGYKTITAPMDEDELKQSIDTIKK